MATHEAVIKAIVGVLFCFVLFVFFPVQQLAG